MTNPIVNASIALSMLIIFFGGYIFGFCVALGYNIRKRKEAK